MAFYSFTVPAWLRAIYLIPTIVSFIPQLHRLYTHRTATALSGRYLLFHVIVSVETFSLMLLATISAPESEYRNQPRVQPGDWLNLAQTAVEASGWLAIFALHTYLPATRRDISRTAAIMIAVLFTLFSLVPVVTWEADDHILVDYMYIPFHLWLLTWVMTALVMLAPVFQAKALRRREPGEVMALSIRGLQVQAFVFVGMGVAWAGRRPTFWTRGYGKKEWDFKPIWEWDSDALWEWYMMEGRMVLNSLILAVGQGVLLGVWKKWGRVAKGEAEGNKEEEEFLLEGMEGRPGH